MKNLEAAQLHSIIAKGEGQLVEFKRKFTDGIAKGMVAFANSSGGQILIGVDDDHSIVPVFDSNALRAQIRDLADNCDPPISFDLAIVVGVCVVYVYEGTQKPYSCKDGYYRRNGASSRKMKRDELIQMLHQSAVVSFEETLCPELSLKMLDPQLLRDLKHRCIKQNDMSDSDFLVNLGFAVPGPESLRFRQVAALFLMREPHMLLPQVGIQCLWFAGKERVEILDQKEFRSGLVVSIEGAMHWLVNHMDRAIKVQPNQLEHQVISEFPTEALRELLINAVVHRDYHVRGAMIQVCLFADRLEIVNPGGLVAHLQAEDFGKLSASRNPLLREIFHRMHWIERAGSGIPRVNALFTQGGLVAPTFSFAGCFQVTARRIALPVGGDPVKMSEIMGGDPVNIGEIEEGDPVSTTYWEGDDPVNDAELRKGWLLHLISKKRVRRRPDAMEILQISDVTAKRYLQDLTSRGYIHFQGAPRTGGYELTLVGQEQLETIP
jgi:ATP-dependent DNA helicase RecG